MPLSPEIQDFIHGFKSRWDPSVNAACERFFETCHASLPPPDAEPSIACEKDVKYGPDPRHRLDIFWPTNASTTNATLPVVVYFHGGAFKAGDNTITPHLHANIGKFFADNGMIGVLGTYRLLPDARFPDGRDDVAAALTWLHDHIHQYGGDRNSIFALGQSAGGGHLAMALYAGRLISDEGRNLVRGVLLLSAALEYDLGKEDRRRSMEAYYGTNGHEFIHAHSALGAFKKVSHEDDEAGGTAPDLFLLLAEWDFEECVRGNLDFLQAYNKQRRRVPRFEVLSGHNHVSYCLSIGLPGDGVGPKIVEWARQCLKK
ncbi:alpha/beta hydrolase [Aspergillus brunneoviolaceus CBS 621.78]|uniref:Alpha/beta-hydrolase n=1 Tax=Aspergillus brunneoviolaceus CBS 621.78 TaxID=1450534 RepID=A0ACD1GDM8_9EURO|nr:alpha/beta-hydrolase [Aspergillus brunneoviolaceus CBS 621.78]RAH47381.1 alpha/beta-hydrolase [Aspergillus brunneoviolaceus CBS 621.78]